MGQKPSLKLTIVFHPGPGNVGTDIDSISVRISPASCYKDMIVNATASSDDGLRSTVTDRVSKVNSYGSTTFGGSVKVYGSA